MHNRDGLKNHHHNIDRQQQAGAAIHFNKLKILYITIL